MFKVFICNRFDDGRKSSDAILVEEFKTLLSAKREGKTHLLTDKSFFYVKEYEEGFSHIIGGEQDTGRVAYSSRGLCEDCPSTEHCVGSQSQCAFYKGYIQGKRDMFRDIMAGTPPKGGNLRYHFACANHHMFSSNDIKASFNTYEEALEYQTEGGFWGDDCRFGIITQIDGKWYKVWEKKRNILRISDINQTFLESYEYEIGMKEGA